MPETTQGNQPSAPKLDPSAAAAPAAPSAQLQSTQQPPETTLPSPQPGTHCAANVDPHAPNSDLKKLPDTSEKVQPSPPSAAKPAPHDAAKVNPPDAGCDSNEHMTMPATTQADPPSAGKLDPPSTHSGLKDQMPEMTQPHPASAAKADSPSARKMQSVQGFIRSVTESKFVAAFAIDDKNYCIIGKFNINMQKFISTVATLRYDASEHIVPSNGFKGLVDRTNLTLNSDPAGVWVIEANYPAIVVGNEVSGKSAWRVG